MSSIEVREGEINSVEYGTPYSGASVVVLCFFWTKYSVMITENGVAFRLLKRPEVLQQKVAEARNKDVEREYHSRLPSSDS